MAVTDRQVMEEIQYTVIETPDLGATWASGLWSVTEVLAYLNQRQYRFMKETQLVLTTASVTANSGSGNAFDLPIDWVSTYRAGWKQSTTYRPLQRTDTWQADHGLPTWESTAATPSMFMDADGSTLKITLAPAPATNGTIELIYVALTTLLDRSGVNLTVPDEFAPYIKWGVLADMLSKNGRGQDLQRAQYAEQRFAEGIALAHTLIGDA